jgi:hypothetical protein
MRLSLAASTRMPDPHIGQNCRCKLNAPRIHQAGLAHFVLSDSIAESVGFQSALAGFDFEVRRLLGYCEKISFLYFASESEKQRAKR